MSMNNFNTKYWKTSCNLIDLLNHLFQYFENWNMLEWESITRFFFEFINLIKIIQSYTHLYFLAKNDFENIKLKLKRKNVIYKNHSYIKNLLFKHRKTFIILTLIDFTFLPPIIIIPTLKFSRSVTKYFKGNWISF